MAHFITGALVGFYDRVVFSILRFSLILAGRKWLL